MKSAIIIGGGPAGCQCALWLKLLGHEALLVEQTEKLGGLQALSPYPNDWMAGVMHQTGVTFAKEMQKHLERFDVPILLNTTIQKIISHEDKYEVDIAQNRIETKCIVIASGVLPRSDQFYESSNVIIGPGMRLFDYSFYGKRVAVLGGGDNACENYTAVMQQKPELCHLYARAVRARKSLADAVNVSDIYLAPYQVDQETMTITHQNQTKQYDVIVVMYGWQANLPAAFLSHQSILCDDTGFIMTDKFCKTRMQGVYAIGEIANRMHPCVTTVMADGVVAAKAIQETVEGSF